MHCRRRNIGKMVYALLSFLSVKKGQNAPQVPRKYPAGKYIYDAMFLLPPRHSWIPHQVRNDIYKGEPLFVLFTINGIRWRKPVCLIITQYVKQMSLKCC